MFNNETQQPKILLKCNKYNANLNSGNIKSYVQSRKKKELGTTKITPLDIVDVMLEGCSFLILFKLGESHLFLRHKRNLTTYTVNDLIDARSVYLILGVQRGAFT